MLNAKKRFVTVNVLQQETFCGRKSLLAGNFWWQEIFVKETFCEETFSKETISMETFTKKTYFLGATSCLSLTLLAYVIVLKLLSKRSTDLGNRSINPA